MARTQNRSTRIQPSLRGRGLIGMTPLPSELNAISPYDEEATFIFIELLYTPQVAVLFGREIFMAYGFMGTVINQTPGRFQCLEALRSCCCSTRTKIGATPLILTLYRRFLT